MILKFIIVDFSIKCDTDSPLSRSIFSYNTNQKEMPELYSNSERSNNDYSYESYSHYYISTDLLLNKLNRAQ